MKFLADTVTLVRHFSRTGTIGAKAKREMQAADRGENQIFVSAFSFVEILYLTEKQRIPLNLSEYIDRIARLDNYEVIDLNLDIIKDAPYTRGLELHDRLIVSTERVLGVPMLTSDKMITESGLVEVVWN